MIFVPQRGAGSLTTLGVYFSGLQGHTGMKSAPCPSLSPTSWLCSNYTSLFSDTPSPWAEPPSLGIRHQMTKFSAQILVSHTLTPLCGKDLTVFSIMDFLAQSS